MTRRYYKTVLCLIIVSFLFELSADFVLGAISDMLAIQIRDIQQLVAQEQKEAEERQVSEQLPASVVATEAPDGGKNITIEASINLHFEMSLSGETIRTYSLKIVDLVAAKNAYGAWKNCFDLIIKTELAFILILSVVFRKWNPNVRRIKI